MAPFVNNLSHTYLKMPTFPRVKKKFEKMKTFFKEIILLKQKFADKKLEKGMKPPGPGPNMRRTYLLCMQRLLFWLDHPVQSIDMQT
jgi:hypothetical protein